MTKRTRFTGLMVLAGLALGDHARADAPPVRYDIVPLQAPPGANENDGDYCEPVALNSKGEAVGQAELLGDKRRFYAALWDVQGNLHTFGTATPDIQYDAQSINGKGQIVGTAVRKGEDSGFPFVVQDGQLVPLKTLPGFAALIASGAKPEAFIGGEAINNAGQILFHVDVTARPLKREENLRVGPQAVLYDAGHFQELSPLPNGNQVRAYGLNDAGMVVGGSNTGPHFFGDMSDHAFLWQKGKMTDLGIPQGFDGSDARAVNAQGQVVGTMWRKSENADDDSGIDKAHGFFWDHGKVQDLGALPGCAYTLPAGINAAGQVVGNSYNIQKENDPDVGVLYSQSGGADGSSVAFLWQNGQMQDLQKLVPVGWELYSAVAINDKGEILCTGNHDGMPSREFGGGAFVLRPR